MKRCIFISMLILSFPLYSLTHTVEKGDTLYSLARKYDTTVSDICELNNNMKTTDVLKPGQKLIVTKEKENVDSYTVKQGDTMYSLARKFGVTVETLSILNAMSNTDIKAGQTIYVPMAVTEGKSSAESAKNVASNSVPSKTTSKTTAEIEELEDLRMTDSRTYDKNKTANKNLKWPVNPKEIQYVTGKVSGVAITSNENESVKSLTDGTVMFCGVYRGFGNVVFVQNKSGYMYVYSNLSKITVKEGDSVAANQKIGNVSVDTRNGKPQLMFMVFKGSDPIDPAKAPRA